MLYFDVFIFVGCTLTTLSSCYHFVIQLLYIENSPKQKHQDFLHNLSHKSDEY